MHACLHACLHAAGDAHALCYITNTKELYGCMAVLVIQQTQHALRIHVPGSTCLFMPAAAIAEQQQQQQQLCPLLSVWQSVSDMHAGCMCYGGGPRWLDGGG